MCSWFSYYAKVTEIYKLIEHKDSEILYQSKKSALYSNSGVHSNYRGVIKIHDNETIEQLYKLIDEAKILFFKAVGSEKRRLPPSLPRILEDDKVFKMHIHTNKAHSSVNYAIGDFIPIAIHEINSGSRKFHRDPNFWHDDPITRELPSIKNFEELGYTIKFKTSNDKQTIYIDAKRMCEIYDCQSIQLRKASGKQIRANFFTNDDEGFIEKSVLKSVGVLLLKPHQNVEVVHSHHRKVRRDAIYSENHMDEIILEPAVDRNLLEARFYKKFNFNHF